MATGPLNVEGQKGIRVMRLSYFKNSFLRKTSNKSICACNKGVCLNIEQEVARDTNVDCIPVNLECKSEICKECGKVNEKRKVGFFKSLRKRFWLKPNIVSDSVKTKFSTKQISGESNCSFQNVPCDNKLKDENAFSNSECSEKLPCDMNTSELNEEASLCNIDQLNNKELVGFESGISASLVSNSPITHTSEVAHEENSAIEQQRTIEQMPAFALEDSENVRNTAYCDEVHVITDNLDNCKLDGENECLPLPSPKSRSLTCELLKLSKYGWYWGPISREEAEEKLQDQPDGAFLVRDSSADHYLLSLSFRSSGKLLHTRIEHSQGLFSFYHQPEQEGFATIGELIDHSVSFSQSAIFCYSRPRSPGYPAFPVRLTKPVSRFTQVRSLQYLCRFIIRQYIRVDNIQKLPLPNKLKGYIQEGHY